MRQILDAVAEHLMSRDEEFIRIPEIAKEAGVNYGSVYHHFGSREGVINAAYEMIFKRLVEEDLDVIRRDLDVVTTFEEFASLVPPRIYALTAGADRVQRRALRVRIVAAAMTRPDLREMIAASQREITDQFREIVETWQARGFVRPELPPEALAVMIQIISFGRTLDDVSETPITDAVWQQFLVQLMVAWVAL